MTTPATAAAAGRLFRPAPQVGGTPPEVTLVSRYRLDGGLADDNVNSVNGTVVGTWTDLTTDSLAVGVAGTSFYKAGGTAHVTLPSGQAAHDLSALSLVFYLQPSGNTNKHILFACGDGTAIGDFSIERLTNGRLRSYHVGQDGGLRFFESTDGIAATNLVVGTAYRIALTFGPSGAKLYLNDTEVASIPQNTNGWNNARVKYMGVWVDAVQGPAQGVFDHLRLWSGELTASGVAALQAAQSITLPTTEGEALSVPSLAEWLPSDEADPVTITKYVSNQNRGDGSGSSAANAQEVQAALNGASAGQTFLAVCQTPGTIEYWNYPSGLNFPSGTSGNYITLQARQGDGVVISATEAFAGSRSSGFWTQSGLSQADIDKKIWRSTGTFSGGAENMIGYWIEFDHPHQLLRAGSMTNLRATYGTADSPTNYSGPMVHKDTDGRVYIRFQRPHVGKYSAGNKWSTTAWPGHPEAVVGGQFVYPISENPNDYVIHLARATSGVFGFKGSALGTSWFKIGAGINSLGYQTTIRGNNTWMDRGTHLCWWFIMFSQSGNPRTNMFFNRGRFSDGSKQHLCRAEWKFGGWLVGIRSASYIMANSDTMDNIYWKDCTVSDFHEIFVGANRVNRVRWRNCTFHNILDDGIQCNFNANRVEIGYCYFRGSAYGGMGVGGEAEGDATVPGEFFMHHNVLDVRFEVGSDWRGQPHPRYPYLSHSPDGRSPWKTYNNLILFGPDTEEEFGTALMHCPTSSDNTLTGAANMHEVFNNIILRVFVEGTKRYDPSTYSLGHTGQSDYVNGGSVGSGHTFIRYSAAFSNELFDYNCYWRPAGMSVNPFFENYRRGRNQTPTDHASLAAWKAHAEFEHSKLSGSFRGAYTPGFDGNSTESPPTLPAIDNYPTDRFKYRPSATSVVTTAASASLSGANWWTGLGPSWGRDYFPWNDGEKSLAPSAWKGALDPNGSTLPVGVQNP